MYIQQKRLERELQFTKTYIENKNEDKAVREARCLDVQIRNYFVSPKELDVIASRINRPFLVFSPCIEGDEIDKIAYGIDNNSCLLEIEKMIEEGYSKEYISRCNEMLSFWNKENTNTKIRANIPTNWGVSFGKDEFFEDNAVIHPIYRLAGANLNFKKLFKKGLNGLISECNQNALNTNDAKTKNFYLSISSVLNSIKMVISNYIEDITTIIKSTTDEKRLNELNLMNQTLKNIHENPPKTLREAIQLEAIYLLCGRNVELGRLDDYLGEFYKNDLNNGVITYDEAFVLINNFFSIIHEERGRDTRAIIGGKGRENEESADLFAMLILDITESRKLHFYPQVSLRFYKEMNEKLYNRALEILAQGNTFPILYNDDVNIPSTMRAMDVPMKVAEQYSFFGCGEFMLSCKSIGTPDTTFNIAKVLDVVLHNGFNIATKELVGVKNIPMTNKTTFVEFLDVFKQNISYFSDMSGKFQEILYDTCNEECSFLLMSCLFDDCLEKGKALLDGGIFHLGGTVETYGNVTAYDSIVAIKKVVFDDKKFTLEELVEILDANFIGYEKERKLLMSAPKYGNDDDYADDIAVDLHEYICNAIRNQKNKTRLDSFLVVVINNNMNVTLGKFVGATPDGRLESEYLSNGNSPYTGCDKEGITALMKSMNKLDTSIHACASQNIKLSASMFENHLETTKSILKTFFDNGAQQINLSVVNQSELEEAMIHPEKHENLIVRVGGFTARFVDLEKETQRDVLLRTAY